MKENTESKQQIIAVRYLIIFIALIFLAPVFWHQFIDIPKDNAVLQEELDSLKLIYLYKKDSLDKVEPKVVYKERDGGYHSQSYSKKPYHQPKSQDQKRYDKTAFKSSVPYSKPVLEKFSLNTATVENLTQVNGIGEVYANRIIKYRSSLGGFYNRGQLYEVYGIDSAVVEKVFELMDESSLIVDTKIKINKVAFKALLKHPYMEYEDVRKVFNNRPIFSEEMFCRILPNHCSKLVAYLDFEE